MAYGNYYPATYNPMIQPWYSGANQSMVQAPGNQMSMSGMAGAMNMPAMAAGMAQNAVAAQSNGIIWVQGESGAKAYPVAPGANVLLMDSEGERFYIKGADPSGMPLPLRIFEYRETTRTFDESRDYSGNDREEYATRRDFEDLNRRLDRLSRKIEGDNDE